MGTDRHRAPVVAVFAVLGACTSARAGHESPSDAGAPLVEVAGAEEDASSIDSSDARRSSDARDAAIEASADAALDSCPGCGFWDPDFSIGTWRTDFDDPLAGTPSRPLDLTPCPFVLGVDPEVLNGAGSTYFDENAGKQVGCDRWSTTYPSSNSSSSAASWPLDRFWVISANNERAYGAEGACSDSGPNTGPPNQSKPVAAPGQGVFGVDVSGHKATLAIDTKSFPNCVSPTDKGKIPFLSIGAQTGRGQSQPITFLNDPSYPTVLKFRATLEDVAPAGVASSTNQARANFGYVFVEAQWGGLRRWVFIDLFARVPGGPSFVREHWNWNVRQSMWYPGAEIIYLAADRLVATCNSATISGSMIPVTKGASANYSLDLETIYRCLGAVPDKAWSDALPQTPLAITGVHWAIEQTFGKNWTRLSIDGLELTK
jgi:hypothetical protein